LEQASRGMSALECGENESSEGLRSVRIRRLTKLKNQWRVGLDVAQNLVGGNIGGRVGGWSGLHSQYGYFCRSSAYDAAPCDWDGGEANSNYFGNLQSQRTDRRICILRTARGASDSDATLPCSEETRSVANGLSPRWDNAGLGAAGCAHHEKGAVLDAT